MVSRKDLFYLWCLREGHQCNLGYYFALYFEKMVGKKNGALCGGSYVTRLARNLKIFGGVIPLEGLTAKPKMSALDFQVMKNMGMVKRKGTKYIRVRRKVEEVE